MDISSELRDYQAALIIMGIDPSPLAAQAEALVALSDSEFEQALLAFNVSANEPSNYARVPDYDYGSLLLEALADACTQPHRRQRLYLGAQGRAAMFASWATSGGEGMARMIDVERIARKLESVGLKRVAEKNAGGAVKVVDEHS